MRTINVTHGNVQVSEYEVDITEEMRSRALSFAREIIGGDNQYTRLAGSRNQQIAIQRTYVGKLGELAFLELLHDKGIECDAAGMFEIYEGQENTDSYDFITADRETVDIKTGYMSNHTRLMVNMEQLRNLPKDYYVAIKLNATENGRNSIVLDSIRTARIMGYASYDDLNNVQAINFGEGSAKALKYTQLTGIDSLISKF